MRGHREAPNNPPEATRPSRLLSYKHPALLSPLECALTESPTTVHSKRLTQPDKSFRMRSYEKTGGGAPAVSASQPPVYSKGNRLGFAQHATVTHRLFPFSSTTYELPNLQALCFHNDATVPGVWGAEASFCAAKAAGCTRNEKAGVMVYAFRRGWRRGGDVSSRLRGGPPL